MNINFVYDPSTASAPSGFFTALNAVAQTALLDFTDPITVNIQVGWGDVNGRLLAPNALGQSTFYFTTLTYSQLKTELMQHASSIDDVIAINNMPAANPFGVSPFWVSYAQAKAWGLVAANNAGTDGFIGFNKTAPWDFNPSDGISPGFYDFAGVALHEITETFGRIIPNFPAVDLLDLFSYGSPGHFYFSIDGGKTSLNTFATSGDPGDWAPHRPPDAFDTSGTPGQVASFTSTDFREMDVLGFNLNFANLNLSSANNVALPAQITYPQMYGVPPSSTELWNLKVFDTTQSLYGQSIGVQDAAVYMYQALGQALADQSDTGSTAFKSTWGPQAISNDATFAAQAYAHVFGVQGTLAQIQHFVDQVSFFDKLYTASGAFGTNASEIDLLARGAVYGQMLGIKVENTAAVASTASALTDVALVGVSSQHDLTHDLV
jgi:hypothetical protein